MAAPAAGSRGALTLEFLFGRGFVTASNVALCPWARLASLRLELPATRGPVDLSGGLARFSSMRPRLHEATLRIDAAALSATLREAADAVAGFEAPAFAWNGDEGELVVERSGCVLACVLRAASGPGGQLRIALDDVVATGALPAPATLLLAEFVARLASSPSLTPPVLAHLPATDVRSLSVDVPSLVSAAVLLSRGWKLPARYDLPPLAFEGVDGALTLQLSRDARSRVFAPRSAAGPLRTADLRALEGDLAGAIDGLRAEAARHDAAPEVRLALADLLLASRTLGADDEATRHASAEPVAAVAARARAAAHAGDGEREASALRELAETARLAGRTLLARRVERGAAPIEAAPSPVDASSEASHWLEIGTTAYYEDEDGEAALEALERARALDPDGFAEDYAALSALEDLYREANDAESLLSVLEAKLSRTAEPEIRSVFRLTMASVLLDELARPDDAARLCEAVLAEDPRSIPARRRLAEAHAARGEHAAAAALFDDVLEMPELDEIEGYDVLRASARAHAASPDGGDAVARFERVLESFPGDTEALSQLKGLHAERGDWSAYLAVTDRELALLQDGEALEALPAALQRTAARVLLEAAHVQRTELGAPAQACDTLQRALALAPADPEVLEALAWAARDAGEHAMLADALTALAPMLLDDDARAAADAEARAARARVVGPPPEDMLPDDEVTSDPESPEQALEQLEQRLRATRDPGGRKALLLEKGYLLLDELERPRAALLPLKGALILDASAVETRLALVRAYAALGDGGQAADQVRELADALAAVPPSDGLLALVGAALEAWLRSDAAPRSDAWFGALEARAPGWAARLELAPGSVRT